VAFGSRPGPACGCFTDWRSTGESYGKVGMSMLEHPPDALRVGIARLLDGYEERDGRCQCSPVPRTGCAPVMFEGREIEVRAMDNAGD
jgi:hypothetical protein